MLEKNTNLIIGNIDSGKTKGLIFKEIPKLIEKGDNLFVLDNKHEYYNRFYQELKDNDYSIVLINLDDATKTNGWNPLIYPYALYKNGNMDKSLELVKKISDVICHSEVSNSDPYWELTSSGYLAGLIITLFKKGKLEEINFGSVTMMIEKGDNELAEKSIMKQYFDTLSPITPEYILGSSTVYAPKETKQSILSVLRQKVSLFLMQPEILNMLSINEFNINDVNDKTAIFLTSKNSIKYIANMFVEQLVMANKVNKKSFTYILDGFQSLPKLDIITELIENATYNNTKLIATIHNQEEINDIYGKNIFSKVANTINMSKLDNIKIDDTSKNGIYPNINKKEMEIFDVNKLI